MKKKKKGEQMLVKESSLKIGEPFNNCPGWEVIKKMLDEEVGRNNYLYVDLKDIGVFKNDMDCACILLKDKKVSTLLGLTTAVSALLVDEFHWVKKKNNYICRLWWD